MDANRDHLAKEVKELRKAVNEQGVRLTLAQAWINLYQFAYDALLHYGVNYRSLKEFGDDEAVSEAMEMGVTGGRNKIIEYLGKLHNAIRAAVNRKQFKVH